MKKLYAFTLMAAVGLSASAVTFNTEGRTLRQAVTSKTRTVQSINEMQPVQKMENGTMKIMKARKADTNTSLEGTWTFALGDYYFEDSALETIYVNYEASFDTEGSLWFEDPTGYEVPMVANYDAKASTLTFPRQVVATDDYGGYILQAPFVFVYSEDPTVDPFDWQPIVGTYNADSQTISFKADNAIGMMPCDSKGNVTQNAFYSIYDIEGAYMVTWDAIGTGSFLENIVYSMFVQGNVNTTYADVNVYEDSVNPGVYMIEDAFSVMYSKLKITATSPSMIIDAREPSDVQIELQSSGITATNELNQNLGETLYMCASWYYDFSGDKLEPFVYITSEKDSENNVTITFPVNSCWIVFSNSDQIYYGSKAESILKFKGTGSGVSSIEAENGAIRYFNLQGVEVKNPQPGTVVIKVADGKATKLIAR